MKRLAMIMGVLATGVVTLGATACSGPAENDATEGSPKSTDVTLMLNFYPYGDHAPIYYGLKEGIYEKHGINLKIEPGKGSVATAQAVGAGNVDFGWADTSALLSAVDSGVPVKSVGVFYQTTPSAVQFFTDSGITSPADLKGRTIAITPGDPYTLLLPAFLQRNEINIADVKTVNVQAAAKISAVLSGQADALCGFMSDQGPILTEKSGKPTGGLLFADYGLNFFGSGLVIKDDQMAADPELVRAMWAATSEAFVAARQDPDAAVAAMKGASPTLPAPEVLTEQFTRAREFLFAKDTEGKVPGTNTTEDWASTIRTLTDVGVIKSERPVETYYIDIAQ